MNETFSKVFAYLRGFFLKRKIQMAGPVKCFGRITVRNRHGIIKLGEKCSIYSGAKLVSNSRSKEKTAVLTIGNCSSIGDRTQIQCRDRVTIGHNVLIAWDVNILEHDFHSPGGGEVIAKPIIIEDEVWIGVRAIILKGVTIGRGAIIGAGALITKDVPPFTFAGGNPAKNIKKVASWMGTTEESVGSANNVD
ncbi:MAG: acyltransferase [candidate division Zixibacteria bacterium]|nr:acyltransferase [candidate division Zixibacteria bacterium]